MCLHVQSGFVVLQLTLHQERELVCCRPPPCYQDYVPLNAVQRLTSEGVAYSIRQLPEPLNPMPAAYIKPSMPGKPHQVTLQDSHLFFMHLSSV
jgi:hypothetical protein